MLYFFILGFFCYCLFGLTGFAVWLLLLLIMYFAPRYNELKYKTYYFYIVYNSGAKETIKEKLKDNTKAHDFAVNLLNNDNEIIAVHVIKDSFKIETLNK